MFRGMKIFIKIGYACHNLLTRGGRKSVQAYTRIVGMVAYMYNELGNMNKNLTYRLSKKSCRQCAAKTNPSIHRLLINMIVCFKIPQILFIHLPFVT